MPNYISNKAKLGKDIIFAKNIIIEEDIASFRGSFLKSTAMQVGCLF